MANLEIRLLDENFEACCDPIDAFTSLSYSRKWSEDGDSKLVLSNDYFQSFMDATYASFDGLLYDIETVKSDDELQVSGRNLNCLLSRIVVPSITRVQGNMEVQIRALVTAYAINGTQGIDKLTLGPLHGYTRAMDAQTQRGSLSDFLYTELNKRGFSFTLTYDWDTDEIIFDIVEGLDRTQDQEVNETALFSTSEGNVENVSYTRSTKEFFNYAIVNDEDKDAPQIVEVDMTNGDPVRAMYVSGSGAKSSGDALGNLLVMVGASGMIKTSSDGINWTTRTSGTVANLWSIDYQNGLFIAGGDGGIVDVSSDGVTWSVRATGGSRSIEGVNYSNGIYLAYERNTPGSIDGVIYYSYDTITWHVATSSMYKVVNAAITTNGFVVYTGGYDTLINAKSIDGTIWEKRDVIIDPSADYVNINRTLYVNGNIICVGRWYNGATSKPYVLISSDNGNSESEIIVDSLSGEYFLDATYGLNVIVAVGQPNIIAYSLDGGLTWTNCTPAESVDFISVAFDGTNFYAVGYTTRKVAISSDGINWTVHGIVGVSLNPDAITYGTSSYTASLYEIGVNALQAQTIIEEFNGDILPNKSPLIGTDCDIGDIVDISDPERGIMVTKRLYGWERQMEPDKDILVPSFGEPFLSLTRYIKKEINKRS